MAGGWPTTLRGEGPSGHNLSVASMHYKIFDLYNTYPHAISCVHVVVLILHPMCILCGALKSVKVSDVTQHSQGE